VNITHASSDNLVRYIIHGIDIDVTLNGSVSYLWKRSITFDHMKIRNLTINFAITPSWDLKGAYSSMQDFDLVVEEPLISRALYESHEAIV